MAALLALALFTIPAMAVNDTVDVSVTIDSVQSIDYTDGPFSITLDDSTDLDTQYHYFVNNSDDDLSGATNVSGDKIYVKYTTGTSWDTNISLDVEYGSGWLTLTTTNQEVFDPSTGSFGYDADLRAGCSDWWSIAPGTYDADITFTLTT